MAKIRSAWRCQSCGASAPRWMGRCSECGDYGTFVEEIEQPVASPRRAAPASSPIALVDVGIEECRREETGLGEFDRVLGGGFVAGSLVLLGGEPGIGKSTLLLQMADSLATATSKVLYVCGEESPSQVGLRATRLGARSGHISLLPELDIAAVENRVRSDHPAYLIVDSIQTAFDSALAGAPGSVGQVRACTARLMRIAKDLGVTTVIVGHVTKDGSIAGPRVLEHMVDAVLYFEGDRDHAFRVVRAVKNRFGSADEIGIFEMTEAGLVGVGSASATLLADRSAGVPGSAVMAAIEGSRPLLVEIQALVTPSYLPAPRRLANGIDSGRLLQVIAVLERRAGLSFSGQDVYVSAAGGLKISEPAVDLPLALALASALKDRAVPDDIAAFGEIDLTGRVRPVSQSGSRLREIARLGMSKAALAITGTGEPPAGLATQRVSDVAGAVRLLA